MIIKKNEKFRIYSLSIVYICFYFGIDTDINILDHPGWSSEQ